MITFKQLVDAIEENNRINDGKWADWSGFLAVLEVYGEYSDSEISREDAQHIIESAIASDGEALANDLRALEMKVMGQNFAGGWWDRGYGGRK
jgi:hypothetical protein